MGLSRELKFYLKIGLVFFPIFVSFITNADFWPITSYPMFSRPQKIFYWPQVKIKSVTSSEWKPLLEDRCYGKIGSVRLHYSVLSLANSMKPKPIQDYTLALAKEISQLCPEYKGYLIQVSLYKHLLQKESVEDVFATHLTGEVAVEN